MLHFVRILLCMTGSILLLDAFVLIAQHKIHLGTLLPLFIGLIFLIHAWQWTSIQTFLQHHVILKQLWKMSWVSFCLWLITLFGFFIYLHQQNQSQSIHAPVQAIIVLGSGVIQGQASPTLARRLDRAAQVAQQESQAIVIVSGGHDLGETQSEAEVMSAYLQQQGSIAKERIVLEDQSTSTALNLKNSLALLQQHGLHLNSPIAVVTSDFHVPRSAAIAQRQGYTHATFYAAETPLMTRYNAWLREYFAYISGWVLDEY